MAPARSPPAVTEIPLRLCSGSIVIGIPMAAARSHALRAAFAPQAGRGGRVGAAPPTRCSAVSPCSRRMLGCAPALSSSATTPSAPRDAAWWRRTRPTRESTGEFPSPATPLHGPATRHRPTRARPHPHPPHRSQHGLAHGAHQRERGPAVEAHGIPCTAAPQQQRHRADVGLQLPPPTRALD
jgi:hypothetical protein